MKLINHRLCTPLLVLILGVGCQVSLVGQDIDMVQDNRAFEGYETVVRDTHKASLEVRKRVLQETVAKDSYWIKGNWGETIWCLAALYLNEKTDKANAQLLENAQAYCKAMKTASTNADFRPEKKSNLSPWAYFALADYLRILCLFHSKSPHYPGRLKPKTEAAMKEALWWLVKAKSKVKEASLDHILVHHGTENHDLTLRPNYYLAAALFKDDPAFKDRRYDDGYSAIVHYSTYNDYFREWPRRRAMIGMWFEVGSDTYQKYSWPAIFNLHELSPDPLVRKRFGMLLDIALVEEAQVSIRGRRGGGRSRAGYGKNSFEGYKALLYAPKDGVAGCSHSKVMETSRYQAPAAAILLRKMAFPAEKPFLIVNRVPGEMRPGKPIVGKDDKHNSYVSDSALINYAYRTPTYLLGSTLQNPALSMVVDGKTVLKYSGISKQNRWSGVLFHDPDSRYPAAGALKNRADNEMCAIYPVVEKTRGGRPQHPHWSFQHKNVLFLQRIAPGDPELPMRMGSYSTGRMSIRFHGRKLKKVEEKGWIFATNGKAFVGVKFLDGEYEWDEAHELASPIDKETVPSTTRVLIHAGDMKSYDTFDAFRAAILAIPLTVEPNRVEYSPGPRLECFRYDANVPTSFKLPRIDGKPIVLRPKWTYRSPYLNSQFGDDRVTVTVGPVKQVYDFGKKDE